MRASLNESRISQKWHSFFYAEPCLIIRNGNPNLALELPSAQGGHFTQLFTNNYALQSSHCLHVWCYLCHQITFHTSVHDSACLWLIPSSAIKTMTWDYWNFPAHPPVRKKSALNAQGCETCHRGLTGRRPGAILMAGQWAAHHHGQIIVP